MTAPLSSVAPLPTGLSVRPLTIEDAGAVTEIYAEVERAEPADQHFDLEEVKEILAAPGIDLAAASIAVTDGDLVVGWATLDQAPLGVEWKAYVTGGVRPSHGRRGIGRFLVEYLAATAERLRDQVAPEVPGTLKLWIPEGREGLSMLSDRAGFRTLRYFFEMRRDLVADPAAPPVVPAGYRLVPWSAELSEAVRLAHNQAFADHWDSSPMDDKRWRSAVLESVCFRPETCRVALDPARQVAGYVITEEFAAETAANGFRTGYIALVGTVRAARGHGVASAVMAASLTALAEAGFRRAELSVDAQSPTGAGRIYSRLGFHQIKRNRTTGRRIGSAGDAGGAVIGTPRGRVESGPSDAIKLGT